jgi:DNA-binding winged helix-turn-helix (wHTH) protein
MDIIQLGPWQLGLTDYSLSNSQQRVELEPLLFKLLVFFANNPRRIITRQELVEAIWQQSYVDDNAINRAISELRKVLQHPELPISPIKTHHRKGYSLQLDPIQGIHTAQTTPNIDAVSPQPAMTEPQSTPATAPLNSKKADKKRFYALLALIPILLIISYFWFLMPHNEVPTTRAVATEPNQSPSSLTLLNRQKITWFKGIESRPLLSPDKAFLAYSHTLPDNHVRTIVRKQLNHLGSAPQEMIIEEERII